MHVYVGAHILVHDGFWFILRLWSTLGQEQNKRKTDIISSWKEAIDHGPAWGYGHYFPNIVSQISTISIIQTFAENITFLKAGRFSIIQTFAENIIFLKAEYLTYFLNFCFKFKSYTFF